MSSHADRWNETKIRHALRDGNVVLLPTETVAGLAAVATDEAAVRAIFRAKKRLPNKPLAVCVGTRVQAEGFGIFSETARDLARAHWPGPLTLVLRACDGTELAPECVGEFEGRRTVALRCPDTAWRDALCASPLALTSANFSGEPAPASVAEARHDFPDLAYVPGGGDPSGKPSTILRVMGEQIEVLRAGEIVLSECP